MMKPVILILFLIYVDCLPLNTTLIKPFYNVSQKISGQDVVFRVVNGKPAKLGDVPYQVALMTEKEGVLETFCGGTIISRSRVLSAAHCVADKHSFYCKGRLMRSNVKGIHAVAGNLASSEYQTFKDGQGHGQWRRLSGGIYPKSYKFPKNDIALLHIEDPFVLNSFVSVVPIARRDIDYNGKLCTISGFGRVSMKERSPILLVAKVKVISKQLCNKVHRRNMARFVCISDYVSDVHKGDSGGPLVCTNTGDPQENEKGLLVGVVSGKHFGYSLSSFFTRVSSYQNFIKSKCSDELHKTPLCLIITLLKLILIQFPDFLLLL